jgi:uncharacterized protein YoxC
MTPIVSWIMGIAGSIVVLVFSVVINRWFKITDNISRRITELERETHTIKKDIEIIKIDLHHDIKDLNKEIQHLSNSITLLNTRLEKADI